MLWIILSQVGGWPPAPSQGVALSTVDTPKTAEQPEGVHQFPAAPGPGKASASTEVYYPDISFGRIGLNDHHPVDQPADNIFHFDIPELPAPTDKVWLSYRLKGVHDHTAVSRSINDERAMGGYLINRRARWAVQKERLNPQSLRAGDNVLRFHAPAGQYPLIAVSDLQLTIEGQALEAPISIVLLNPEKVYYGEAAYVRGLICGNIDAASTVQVNGHPVDHQNGQFEILLEKPRSVTGPWDVVVTAQLPGRETVQRSWTFHPQPAADLQLPYESTAALTRQWVFPGRRASLEIPGLSLSISSDGLRAPAPIAIAPLRARDLPPLPVGMVNVTPQSGGFRLLPDGTPFNEPTRLRMDYDSSLIPSGYTGRDVRTFYFDEDRRRWIALPLDTLMADQKQVVSLSAHFTDFINGVIQVPESPQTQGYTPTTIAGLEAASPAMGVTPIEAPTANAMGTANLSFPLKVPPGRNGLQPQLSINYNSEGGNGWLGLGWSLDIPAIEVDTRWGAPRYHPTLESETYTFQGEQLHPLSHRSALKPRQGNEKIFHPRVEGAFQQIIRHGSDPKAYWWEVIDKDGTRHYYGGRPGEEVVEDAVLTDDRGNIARWMLLETRDLNGNFIRYHCTVVQDDGLADGKLEGRQIYPERITYTGHGEAEGKYALEFIRSKAGAERRPDVQIDARQGFKQVTAELLYFIDVRFDGNLIRRYALDYQEGAFFKTLLTRIAELDKNGEVFYEHTFDYFDEVRKDNNYLPFTGSMDWDSPLDGIRGEVVSPINDESTVLGGSKSNSFSAGLAVTVGSVFGNPFAKTNTGGGNYTYSNSNSSGLTSLVDLSGDGLPDKTYWKNDRLYFRENDGLDGFGAERPVAGLPGNFEHTVTRSNSAGLEGHPYPGFLGYTQTWSTSTTDAYFIDLNGDGLIDIANNGKGYFSFLNPSGLPEFTTRSAMTPSPVIEGELGDVAPPPPSQEEIDSLIDQFPLHDIVRMWQAPFDGEVAIDAPAQLLGNDTPQAEAYAKNDGVILSIQHRGDVLWSDQLLPDGPAEIIPNPNAVGNIDVQRGDRIYFRLQSRDNGLYDQVGWNPVIYYSEEDTSRVDANGKSCFRFTAGEDFLNTSRQVVSLPVAGRVEVSGTFSKPVTSDDVRLQIVRQEDNAEVLLYDTLLAWDKTVVEMPVAFTRDVAAEEAWLFRVKANTTIDWPAISWTPFVKYLSTADNISTVGLDFCPALDYQMYNHLRQKTDAWSVPDSATYRIQPIFELDTVNRPYPPPPYDRNFDITFSVKGVNRLYAKQTFQFDGGDILGLAPLTVRLPAGDSIYFTYHLDDDLIKDAPEHPDLRLGNTRIELMPVEPARDTTYALEAGVHHKIPDEDIIFGPLYRGWGHFAYNGNRERADEAIREDELNADDYELEEGEDIDFDPATTPFIILMSEPKKRRWMGFDTLTYVEAVTMSSSRFGQDDVSGGAAVQIGEDCKYAPNKISKSVTRSGTGGIGPVSGGGTWCTTESITDFMDLNGDRYPDVVFPDRITFTDQLGGLSQTIDYSLGNHLAKSFAVGGGAAGNSGNSNTSNSGNASGAGDNRKSTKAKAKSGRLSYNSKESTESASFVGGISADVNYDTDRAVHSWMDMNGDGLPDKVFETGEVALNLGYSFGPKENWGQEKIRGGESIDIGIGAGVNLFNASFEAGVSSSLSFNSSTGALQDVNGDGLVDYIITEGYVQGKFQDIAESLAAAFQNGEPVSDGLVSGILLPKDEIRVRLNTGNGFSSPIRWPGVNVMDHGSSVAESVNTAITGCVPIPILGIRICFNPNGSLGRGMSRQKTQLTDINGDGFPDHLESENDGDLKVKLSTIGKTNLLKEIQRPFGATLAMDYELVGNTVDLPFGKWVLKATTLDDGLPGDGADRTKYRFDYGNGYYDRHERIFYGFDTVRIHQLDTQKEDQVYRTYVHTYHHRDYYRRGLPKAEYLQDAGGGRYNETRYTYTLKNTRTGNDLPAGLEASDSLTVFPALTRKQHLFYEGEPQPTLSTGMTYAYDRFGNVTEYVDAGDGTPRDRLTTRITYHDEPGRYLVGLPASMEVETGEGTIRRRETDIDQAGNVTQVRQYLADGSAAVFDMEYNAYGLLAKVTRPPNAQGERLFYRYTYDEEVQTYISGITDAYGYQSSIEYEYQFGQPLETVDINGQRMVFSIDARGRVDSLTGPYELASGAPYTLAYEYHTEAEVPYALTRHYDPEHGGEIETYTFVDGLLRPVQIKKTGSLFQGDGQPDQLRMIVSGTTIYDAFGRETANYYPVTEPLDDAPVFNTTLDNIAPTRHTYDVLDRITTTVLPDGATTEMEYGFGETNTGYIAFQTTITDPLSNLRESFTDLRGRRRATAVHGPEGAIWTSFGYNALSELTTVMDHEGNETRYAYDHFGRRTRQHHPDGGLVTMRYDLAGNLVEKVTADIRENIPDAAIEYRYEYERMTGIDYPRNFQNKVQLHYGEAGAPHNRAGRIWLIEDASGGSEYFFGPLGETIKTVRTILTSEGNVRTFVSERRYDTWNRVQEMIYPDGEVVDYAYNRAGKLRRMESRKLEVVYPIVDQLGYDKFEDRVYCAYGNGTATTYAYEPDRRRLQQVRSGNTDAPFIDNHYRYDALGNVLELTNQAAAAAGQLGGAASHRYEYDALYRLTNAAGSWTGAEASAEYQLSMDYDNLYNITSKTQTLTFDGASGEAEQENAEYWYDGDQPHAARRIGNRLLQYDANGNAVSWRDTAANQALQMIWDEENRLMGVSREGYLSQYSYDAGGERAVKSHGPTRGVFANGTPIGATTIYHYDNYTAYVSPYFVAGELNFTKHYYLEDQRVLTKIGTGEFNNDFWNFRGVTAGNKNYVKRLQLLQQAYRQQVERLGLPPGEPTVPIEGFPITGLDSLPDYDNTYPPGWPRPLLPDTTGPPGEPTLVEYEFPDSATVRAGYGFRAVGAPRELNQFFYHPDHLGSNQYITDATGKVRQHTEFLPFGEIFVDQHLHSETQPFLFNGKELDEETGLYYYGARYYDPELSVWMGVDPRFEKYPGRSPYAFVGNNPLRHVDPDGMDYGPDGAQTEPPRRKEPRELGDRKLKRRIGAESSHKQVFEIEGSPDEVFVAISKKYERDLKREMSYLERLASVNVKVPKVSGEYESVTIDGEEWIGMTMEKLDGREYKQKLSWMFVKRQVASWNDATKIHNLKTTIDNFLHSGAQVTDLQVFISDRTGEMTVFDPASVSLRQKVYYGELEAIRSRLVKLLPSISRVDR